MLRSDICDFSDARILLFKEELLVVLILGGLIMSKNDFPDALFSNNIFPERSVEPRKTYS